LCHAGKPEGEALSEERLTKITARKQNHISHKG
jgi:hypothetical protein